MKLLIAMCAAAAVTASFVSGKATRDALFLGSLDFTALPAMLIATSMVSILLVVVHSRLTRSLKPAVLVPGLFLASGSLFLVEWLCRSNAPAVVAVLVYLHISALGPLLASGFWLIVSERFDPRSAKHRFGQIAGAGTLGGFLSALVAERIAAVLGAPAMLLVLALIQVACAVLVWQFERMTDLPLANLRAEHAAFSTQATEAPDHAQSALATILRAPHLRHLSALVLFGTTSAALVDYLFKAQAVETFGRGDQLLRFFAVYYAATSLLTFVLQTSSSRLMLDRFGIGVSTSTPSWALFAGSLGTLIAPSFGSLVVARGGESVLRSSWFRAGYELFYTPIPAAEKRAAKSLIDVGFDRLGDACGGGLVRLAIVLVPAVQSRAILSMAAACSLVAAYAASRLNRGYLGTLASSLVHHGPLAAPDTSGVGHRTTRAMSRVVRSIRRAGVLPDVPVVSGVDAELDDIACLKSRDRDRIIGVLSRGEGLSAGLVPHVIPLLAWDAVANHAMFALQKVAEERVGQLEDALIDPNQDFAVRRRLARVFSIGVSARAASGAMLGLDDARFDVRFQSARALASILDKNPRIDLDRHRIFDVVQREIAVSRPVWESRRLLHEVSGESPLDAFVRDRAGESLAHVFTLLSLVLPREPMEIAFRSLQSRDEYLRGTALEYLEGVLPAPVRERLWPFLEVRPATRSSRPHHDVIADLLRSSHATIVNFEQRADADSRRRDQPTGDGHGDLETDRTAALNTAG